jgi:NADH:ubiquinone oxidoreductase subunit 4 (subunit M)
LTNALIPTAFLISITNGTYTLPLICWGAKILVDLLVAGKGVYTFKRADLLIMFPLWEIVQIPYTILIGLAGTLRGFTWKGREH